MQAVVDNSLLHDAMRRIAEQVDAAFDAILPLPDDAHAPLVEAMRYAAIGGGKRLRPLLVTAVADMYGVDRNASVRAGVALECIHVFSLIHDDLPCMDDDELRHGKPSTHKAFGEATAVLAGDALQSLAFELLTSQETSGDPFVRSELVRVLAKATGHSGMAGGQMMDIVAEESDFDLHTITRLQQMKTGALLRAAVEMGAILGRVAPEGRNHLRLYARDIGLAFQISDDLLDAEGDQEKAGKTLRKDEEKGKQTFLTLLGTERAREQAEMLVQQANGHIASHGEEAGLLRAIARYIVDRDH